MRFALQAHYTLEYRAASHTFVDEIETWGSFRNKTSSLACNAFVAALARGLV